jgi:membrane fusion protein (multidrug efflux system)
MKKSIILYILAGLLIAFAIYKIIKNKKESQSMTTKPVAVVLPAEGHIVRDTSVNYELNTVGTIRAFETVDIGSEISKRLVSINFEEGSTVSEGTLLFKLDDADLKAQLEKLTIQEELAQQNEERSKALLAKGGISQQTYDEELNTLKTLRAEIQIIHVDLDKTEIRAPFSGKIGLRNVSEGAYITPGLVLTTLQDIHKVKVDFSVPERYAGSIREGQKVTFTIPGSPRFFDATILAIQPNVDVTTRNLQIRAVAENTERLLFPGSSVKVFLNFGESGKTLFIPSQCLMPSLKGYSVFVVKNKIAQLNTVKTGIRTKECVQITEGISMGDTLVMTNLLRIRPGFKVKIIKIN